MISATYIDGTPHPQKDKTWAVLKEKGVYINENGGESVSLPEWISRYGGSLDVPRETISEPASEIKELHVANLHWASTIPKNYYGENLYELLSTKFGFLEVESVFHQYNVGVGRDGELIFWYMSRDGKACHDQRIVYGADGKRKRGFRRFKLEDGYVHRSMFGAHLLRWWKGEVCVVESEKTALIMTLADRGRNERIWVATGGSAKMGCVMPGWKLYPDFDGAGSFLECFGCNKKDSEDCIIEYIDKKRVKDWGCIHRNVLCIDWWNGLEVNDGNDVADWVLNSMKLK